MSKKSYQNRRNRGFTVVELLIVIVVIAILAVIVITVFNGLRQRAVESSLRADVDSAKKKILLYETDNGTYPTAINCANPGITEICIEPSGSNTFSYSAVNTTNPPQFGLTASGGDTVYQATQSTSAAPLAGVVTDGLTARLDPASSASYPGSGTVWSDVSGNGRNASLTNVTYGAENGGVLLFNGTNAYSRISSGPVQSIFMFVYIDSSKVASRYLLDSRMGNATGYLYNGGVGNWINLHVDGQPIASSWASIPKDRWIGFYAATAAQYTATTNVMSRFSNGELLPGKLGVVMVYNRSLTADEILQNFNAYRIRYGILN